MKNLRLENQGFKELVGSFREWLDILGYAESTVYSLPIHLQEFLHYLEGQGHRHLQHLTPKTVSDYYKVLQMRPHYRKGGALSKSYLNKHQQALKKFNEYLKQHGANTQLSVHLKSEQNPTEEKLNILTQSEIKALFNATQYSHQYEYIRHRDKAMLVVLYSCGLRRTEAVSLDISDILFDKERIHVRKGKNYKERFVPINRANGEILEDYIFDARPQFKSADKSEALFLSKFGKRIQGISFGNRLRAIVKATGNKTISEKHITLHTLRHSIATHLLQQGVKLEAIKTFLGHSSLESTQIYVHLKEVLEKENV